ncbi:MAG TPA: S26 family signal peptidase, partial [Flavobacteriales bacterium]|nr:S26 family signal peptidase [Flavobacteriales bacterium]
MQILDSDSPEPQTSPRSSLIAFLLSLLVPGLGHFYNGQLLLAVFMYMFSYFIPAVAGLFKLAHTFGGLVLLVCFEIVFRFGVAVHAAWLARRQKNYIPKTYNQWYYTMGVFLATVLVSVFVYDTQRLIGVEAFSVRERNNAPNLVERDCLMADVNWYKEHKPQYGELAVYDLDGHPTIHRVVGLPGDVLAFSNDTLYINNQP